MRVKVLVVLRFYGRVQEKEDGADGMAKLFLGYFHADVHDENVKALQ